MWFRTSRVSPAQRLRSFRNGDTGRAREVAGGGFPVRAVRVGCQSERIGQDRGVVDIGVMVRRGRESERIGAQVAARLLAVVAIQVVGEARLRVTILTRGNTWDNAARQRIEPSFPRPSRPFDRTRSRFR